MKDSKKFWKFWLILAGLLAGLVLLYATFRYIKMKKAEPKPEEEPEETDSSKIIADNYTKIQEGLAKHGYIDENTIKLVVAQAMHETGDFDSAIYEANNNMFGMRQPIKRETLSIGEKSGYASFRTLEDSAEDQAIYFKYVGMPETFESADTFVKFLKDKSYFTDSYINYKNGVKSALNRLNQIINN